MKETPDIESSSEAYAKRFSGPVGQYFLQVQQNAVTRLLAPGTNLTILDVGGGHAQLTPFLTEAGCDVTVLGSTAAGRIQLDSRIGADAYQYDVGDLLALPYDNDTFDVVIAIRLLPHLHQWEKFISELCRVSRSSVIVDYPDKRSANYFADMLFTAKKAVEKDTRPYRCFSSREMERSFSQSAFQSAQSIRQFAVPMAFHRALRSRAISETLEKITALTGLQQTFGSPVIRKFVNQQSTGAETRKSDTAPDEGVRE